MRESKKRGNLIKPAANCVSSTLEKRAKKIATKTQSNFNDNIKGIYHQSDEVRLKVMEFSVNRMDFQINFGNENQTEKNSQVQSVVKAIDQGQISRDSYRELAAVEHHLPRENSISNERIAITDYMNKIIKILLVDMKKKDELEKIIESEESGFMNSEIVQEVINTMGLGIRRSAKDILYYLIHNYKNKKY